MARPREFDPDEAVEKALKVFWQHGYEGASLPELLDGMGLTRGSLYKAFRDKKSLFLLVLERYDTAVVQSGAGLLSDPEGPDGAERILQTFRGLVAAVADGDNRGCLLCTAAATSAGDDPEIAAAVRVGLARLHQAFLAALQDARSLEHLDGPRRLRLADTLLTQYFGLRMLARSKLPLGILESAVDGVADLLQEAAGQDRRK